MNSAIPKSPVSAGAGRLLLLIAIVVVAYHQSLLSLMRGLTLDTPLAYLGLVPLIALGLATSLIRRPYNGPSIHDRQVDFIIGLPLLVLAAGANYLLPTEFSTMFWVWRIDMLTFPLFVAGAAVLIVGTRTTARAKVPIAFLFLAWPYPYTLALFRWLDGFTSLTIRALVRAVAVVPWAAHDASGDGSRFWIGEGVDKFRVSVASQCSGANSLLGFLLVGAALMVLVKGPRLGKALWLLVGAVVTWALNLVRIMIIFFAGDQWGESVAIDGFHPVIGLFLFTVGMLVMVLSLRLFRLKIVPPAPRTASGRNGYPKLKLAIPIAAVITVTLATLNADIVRYSLVASDLGVPRLASFAMSPPTPSTWAPTRKTDTYDWARRFFGEDSTWNRFSLTPPTPGNPGLWANAPIIADVITSSSLSRLNAFGIEACYKFHGYDLRNQVTVDLGGGIKGTSMRWQDGDGPVWTTVYWHWPVVEGGKRRFERVTLLLGDRGSTEVAATDIAFNTVESRIDSAVSRGDVGASKVDERDEKLRSYLVAVARDLVSGQQSAPTQLGT